MTYYVLLRREESTHIGTYHTLIGYTDSHITAQMYINAHPNIEVDIDEYELDDEGLDYDNIGAKLAKLADIFMCDRNYLTVDLSDDGKEYLVWGEANETEFDDTYVISDYIHDYMTSCISLQSMSLLLSKDLRDEFIERMGSLMAKYIIPMIALDVSYGHNVILRQLGDWEDPEKESVYSILDRVKLIRRISNDT